MYEVRRLRQEKGWNQNELAFHADLAPSVISQIETGKREPSATTLRKLSEALDVKIPDLFGRPDPPKVPGPAQQLELEKQRGAADPGRAAGIIRELGSLADSLAVVWNRDVELYEQNGFELQPYRTLEMAMAVDGLYRQFWSALSVLRQHAKSLGLDPDEATWEPESKQLLHKTGTSIRALAELYAVIAARSGDAPEDFRALRQEFAVDARAEEIAGLV